MALSDPRADLTSHIQPQLALFVRQSCGSAGKRDNHLGKRLGKGDARTGGVATQEAPHVEMKLHRQIGPGQISYGALVVTMDVGRFRRAGRTARSALSGSQVEDNLLGRGRERGE